MPPMLEQVQRLTLPIIDALAHLPSVAGILCFGSYAAGTYDQASDVDLYVICDPTVIAPTIRQTTLGNANGVTDFQLNLSVAGWANQWSPQSDSLMVNAVRIELSYNTKEWLTTVVHKVTNEGATSIPELKFRAHTMLVLLASALTLYDPFDWIADLKAQLYPYPAVLQINIISENLPIACEGLDDLRDCAMRGFGKTSFHFYLRRVCDALHSTLFTLNEKYDPATKRQERELAKLALLPANFVLRYENLLEGPFTAAGQHTTVEELTRLIEETKQLIRRVKPSM